MRRMIALLLMMTLLVVSSLPMVAEAATCSMPAHLKARMQMDQSAHATVAVKPSPVVVPENGDRHCQIECACGCHRSADTLPHLLSPSSLSVGGSPMLISVVFAPRERIAPLHTCAPLPAIPPPIFS